MPIVPEEWSVVIVGAWNRAILTPAGISKRLFQLPEGTQLEILVPLDVIAPFRVKHDDISVTAASDRLIINPAKNTYTNMVKAMDIARVALANLPETPVSAAGFNFKFKSVKPVPVLARVVDHQIDQFFADRNYLVSTRAITRTVKWREGEIRVAVSQESDLSYTILMNFHTDSDSTGTLKEWLSVPIGDARREVDSILYDCLGVSEGDINHAEEAD
jgi:hypothetical protein